MSEPRLTLIAAHDRQRAIGRDGAMPWHLPDDLKYFKAQTLGKPVLMGRRTFEAIGRALPGRRNLVLSRDPAWHAAGVEPVATLAAALTATAADPELMVIGGGQVYALALPRASRLLLTEVDLQVAGADAWFPQIDPGQWQEMSRTCHPADARHVAAFEFVELRRR